MLPVRIGSVPLWSAVLHLYLPTVLMAMGQGMIIPALPVVGQTYGVPGALAVQLITGQVIGRFLAMMPTGTMVDRWGAKVPMVIGATLATASGLAAAFSPNFVVLLTTQFFWGFGMTMWTFGREITAADMVPPDQRGRQLSTLMGLGGTGMMFGPAIGGLLTDPVGVRGLFLIFAAMSGFVLLVSSTARSAERKARLQSGTVFRWSRLREIHPYFRLTYAVLIVTTFGVMARGQVTNSMLPLFTQEQIGYSPAMTGLLFSVMGVVTFLTIVPGGFMSDKFGRKWASAPAALLSAAGFLILPFAEGLPVLVVVMVLLGVANGTSMGSMTTYMLDIVPAHARGQLQAFRRTVGEVGSIIGVPVSGVVATVSQPSTVFFVWVPLFLISGLLLMFVAKEGLPRRRPPGAPGALVGQARE
jgi:MFS family permease